MFGDPFTTPITRLLPAITAAVKTAKPFPSSAAWRPAPAEPGLNVLVLDGPRISAGAWASACRANIDIDFIISQGCRPIASR